MRNTAERTTPALRAPRLHLRPLRPVGSPRTPLDGAWWPRSADPAAELPGLLLALQAHGLGGSRGPVTHVLLRTTDWDDRPRRLHVDGLADARVVRLSWFGALPAGLLIAICADGRRIDLLTVPVTADPAAVRAAMELAAHPDNHLHAPDILAALLEPSGPVNPPGTEATENAWQPEGGRLREHPVTR